MRSFPVLAPTLRVLHLNCVTAQRGLALTEDWPGPDVVLDLPNLEVLEVISTDILTPSLLQAILTATRGKLHRLKIHACPSYYRTALDHASEQGVFAKLVDLELAHLRLDDQTVEALARHAPALERVDLRCTQITGISVKALLASANSKLRWLNLDLCTSVSVDAVDYARSKGVEVRYSLSEELKGARRVRYG